MASSSILQGLIAVKGKAPRRLPSWIDAFYEYTDNLPACALFRKWAGVSAIAGALERRVWCTPFGLHLFPNSYIVLVTGAGGGKTVLSSLVAKLWRELPEHYVAPSNVSRATLVDSLSEAKRKIVRLGHNPPFDEFNSLNVAANELGVFIPTWDMDFINHLTDLWDCNPYQERKRGNSLNVKIEKPSLNMLGCTTPKWLMETMPPGAWEFGFTSRIIFAYSSDRIIKDLHGINGEVFGDNTVLYGDLITDLKRIGELYGKAMFEESAVTALKKWHMAGGPPIPTHPKLEYYNTRRSVHLIKLCMILSASERDDLVVTLEHYQRALGMLLELEHELPNIFRAMVAGGDSAAMNDLHFALMREYTKTPKPVAETVLAAFLRERVPSDKVMRVIEIMHRSGMIKQVVEGRFTGYIPLPKKLVD